MEDVYFFLLEVHQYWQLLQRRDKQRMAQKGGCELSPGSSRENNIELYDYCCLLKIVWLGDNNLQITKVNLKRSWFEFKETLLFSRDWLRHESL